MSSMSNLRAWEEEMRDRLADKNARIAELEAGNRELKRSHTTTANELAHAQTVGGRLMSENAALWAFVRDMDVIGVHADDAASYRESREALRPYEKVDVVDKPLPLL